MGVGDVAVHFGAQQSYHLITQSHLLGPTGLLVAFETNDELGTLRQNGESHRLESQVTLVGHEIRTCQSLTLLTPPGKNCIVFVSEGTQLDPLTARSLTEFLKVNITRNHRRWCPSRIHRGVCGKNLEGERDPLYLRRIARKPMNLYADIRCLQDPRFAFRGVGIHASTLLAAAKQYLPKGTDLIGLGSPEIGRLSGPSIISNPLFFRIRKLAKKKPYKSSGNKCSRFWPEKIPLAKSLSISGIWPAVSAI